MRLCKTIDFSVFYMYQTLLQSLDQHAIVLTPNRRLAAFLRQQLALYQQKTQETVVWTQPNILPITAWLEKCWENSLLNGSSETITLLNPSQEQALWEQIVEQSEFGAQLLRPTATARMALQAWQLLQQWQIDPNQSIFQTTENSQIWQSWAKQFHQTCLANHWLDISSLPLWLGKQFQANYLPIPQQIITTGFDELNPSYQQLFSILQDRGARVSEFTPPKLQTQIKKIKLANPEQELETMARWAAQLYQQGRPSIGCVIPNLTEIRQEVLAIFTQAFTPQAQFPENYATPLPFNISAGTKLKDYALINTAVKILYLTSEVKLTEISALLRSPYFGKAIEEQILRAQLNNYLKNYGEPILNLKMVYLAAKKLQVLDLAKNLEKYFRLNSATDKRSPQQWAQYFNQQLQSFGWPGDRTLDSTEHQLLNSWRQLIQQFAQLTLVAPVLSHSQALHHLTILAAQQEFQPKSAQVPVQILGILEAGGLHFDHLWIAGLHHQAWPTTSNPNPFIPLELQRNQQLPHSSSNRELIYCRTVTQRLFNSAEQIIVSYPQQIADLKMQVSPLLENNILEIIPDNLLLDRNLTYTQQLFKSAKLEFLTDNYATPLNTAEILRGGSAIFKNQAACPFRAFASFRLGAKAVDTPQPGLSPQERGSLLHQALATVWNKLENQQNLLQLENLELTNLIEAALNTVFASYIQKRPMTFKQRFIQLEKYRLTKLILDWLEIEKKRAPFYIYSTEQTKQTEFAGLKFTLQADRIDQLVDNKQLIIDYKTGMPAISDWLDERPNDPQLPLYCLTHSAEIAGLLFAQIRSNKKTFIGLTFDENANIPGRNTYVVGKTKNKDIPLSWSELVAQWRTVLTQLAQQYSAGYAEVDPKDGLKTCQTCDLQALCRWGQA